MQFIRQYQVSIFFVVTVAVSAAIAGASYTLDDDNFSILTVLSPTIVAIAITALASGRAGLKSLLVDQVGRSFGWRWLFIALFVIPIFTLIAAFVHSFATGTPFAMATTAIVPYAIIVFVIAIGEEFGWRGYATAQMAKRYSMLTTSFVVGIVWALWHLPGALIGVGTPPDTPFWLFTLWVLAGALIMGWIYARTQSVIPAILFHAAANASFIYLPMLPEQVGSIWPFALLVALAAILAISVYWRDQSLREPPQNA